MAKSASYIIRKIDQDFWNRVKSKAALQQKQIRVVIIELLNIWLEAK